MGTIVRWNRAIASARGGERGGLDTVNAEYCCPTTFKRTLRNTGVTPTEYRKVCSAHPPATVMVDSSQVSSMSGR